MILKLKNYHYKSCSQPFLQIFLSNLYETILKRTTQINVALWNRNKLCAVVCYTVIQIFQSYYQRIVSSLSHFRFIVIFRKCAKLRHIRYILTNRHQLPLAIQIVPLPGKIPGRFVPHVNTVLTSPGIVRLTSGPVGVSPAHLHTCFEPHKLALFGQITCSNPQIRPGGIEHQRMLHQPDNFVLLGLGINHCHPHTKQMTILGGSNPIVLWDLNK